MFIGDRVLNGRSAYTKVGYETCTRLAEIGHQVAHTPIGRVNNMGKQVFENIMIYPSGLDAFAEDVAVQNYHDFQADMLISIKEPWVFNHIFQQAINCVPFAVIDHSPVSVAITARIRGAFKIIAISRHAQLELKKVGLDSFYIPHGVRCDVYKPLDKAECRKRFYLDPEKFTVGIVAMNRARKLIPHMLRGYKRFIELNPDVETQMMLWTNVTPRTPPESVTVGVSDVGVNLVPELMRLKLTDVVQWPKWEDIEQIGGLPERDMTGGWDMVSLYNCFDVNFLCSGGEGAGLPYMESAACHVPSIGTDYAGAPEYVGPGITVPWNDYVIINTPGTRYVMADIDKMAEALTKIYNTNRKKLGRKARRFAERFDWPKIISSYWNPFLEECEELLKPCWKKGGLTKWS